MVVWHHSLLQIPGTFNFIHLPDFGPSGVDLFFVISGFIMFVTTTDKPLLPGEYLLLRIIRVAPLYWLMTIAMVGCAAISPESFRTLVLTPGAIAKSLLFIPYNSLSFPGMPWPILVPGWTLNYEMFFYVVFALCLFFPARGRILPLIFIMAGLTIAGKLIEPSTNPLLWVYTSPLLLEFAAGCLIGYLWSRQISTGSFAIACVEIAAGAILLLMRNEPIFQVNSPMVGGVDPL
jgi:exopolysaccharide production protein ExoZ